LSQWLVHSAIRTSPRRNTNFSAPTEIAPEQLQFTPVISEGNSGCSCSSCQRYLQTSPMNLELKCSLSKQSKCHCKDESLFSCVVNSCLQHVRSGLLTMQIQPGFLKLCCWHGWPRKAAIPRYPRRNKR
jgi:hypothetical protein